MNNNVHYIPNPDVAMKRILEHTTFLHDRSLKDLRHELTMVFLKRMQESHSPADLNRIVQIHAIANAVTLVKDACVIEGAIRDLEIMDPNFVPLYLRHVV